MAKTSFWRLAFSFLVIVTPAWAGLGVSLMQTADVLKPGDFEGKIQNDIIFNNGGGFNISPHFRFGIIEHYLDAEGFLATGTTDFQAGVLGKFNLLPDVDGQIGLSFLGGVSFITDGNGAGSRISGGLITTGALVSKNFEVDFGHINPYGGVQVEFWLNNVSSKVPVTILAGSKWHVKDVDPWLFYSEFAINVSNSLFALSIGAGYLF